jgi:hypothetical protein
MVFEAQIVLRRDSAKQLAADVEAVSEYDGKRESAEGLRCRPRSSHCAGRERTVRSAGDEFALAHPRRRLRPCRDELIVSACRSNAACNIQTSTCR